MDRAGLIASLFGTRRALLGVIHLGALPGTPEGHRGVEQIADAALREARVYHEAGFHGLVIENMHDRPFLKRVVGPEVVAAMAVVGAELRRAFSLPLGVQVLAGANRDAVAVAHSCGAAFVRVEGFVFAHVADEGLIESDAGVLLRYRRAIGAEAVRVFADVKKKHAAHVITADVDLADTAQAAELFRADALVVTGGATGRPADPADVQAAAAAVSVPVLVGSGANPDNVAACAAADGFIVGSWVKRDGLWSNPVDARRAQAMARAVERLPAPEAP